MCFESVLNFEKSSKNRRSRVAVRASFADFEAGFEHGAPDRVYTCFSANYDSAALEVAAHAQKIPIAAPAGLPCM